MLQDYTLYKQPLEALPPKKLLINTLNAHCYNVAQKDALYREALLNSDILISDGISVVKAMQWLSGQKLQKIAGADLFYFEMERMEEAQSQKQEDGRWKMEEERAGKVFFLGSTKATLDKIKKRAAKEFPNVEVETYSPPYKTAFSAEDNTGMLEAINTFKPDVLFVGMTAPKQEKWSYQNFDKLEVGHLCSIGAVFDFYAGTVKRAPQWMIQIGMEWFYRLFKEPKRMWRRYLIGNTKFCWYVAVEKYNLLFKR